MIKKNFRAFQSCSMTETLFFEPPVTYDSETVLRILEGRKDFFSVKETLVIRSICLKPIMNDKF